MAERTAPLPPLGARLAALVLDVVGAGRRDDTRQDLREHAEAAQRWLSDLRITRSQTADETEPHATVRPLVGALVDRPADWSRGLRFLALAVDDRLERGSALHRGSFARTALQGLLDRAEPPRRFVFLQALDLGFVSRIVAAALADADFTFRDAPDAVAALERLSRGDHARAELLDAVARWAERNVTQARTLVQAWRDAPRAARPLQPDAVAWLVRGSAQAPDASAWRQQLLDALHRDGDVEALRVAVDAACLAWPQDASAQERFAALLAEVRRAPTVVSDAGLSRLIDEALRHPDEAVAAALAILDASADGDLTARWSRTSGWRLASGPTATPATARLPRPPSRASRWSRCTTATSRRTRSAFRSETKSRR